jgi:hypothetical protein
MFDPMYLNARERHQGLLQVAHQARLARSARDAAPTLKDRLYLLLGDFFVTLGERFHEESLLFEERVELAGPEFSQEYL